MLHDLDSLIFIGFLLLSITFGIASSYGITTIREYAVGDRNFSTATIAATLIATWVNGSDFFTTLSETYKHGLYYVWAAAGDVLCLLSVGIFFAPRLAEFLGKISIAEAMGELYGKNVRILTALAGCIGTAGIIAVQLKISGLLFEYAFDVPPVYGILIGGGIITMYSSLGGIKSVTFTDVIQLFTFGTIIPAIALFISSTVDSFHLVNQTLTTHELFDYTKVFDFSDDKALSFFFLFFFIAVPGFNPAIFQRIAMSKDTTQVARSFTVAAFSCFFIMLTIAWIGVIVLATQPHLDSSDVVKHILFDYSMVGLKGLTLTGVMAMVMSTADSYINSSAVLFVHDFCRPIGVNLAKNELAFARFASLIIGVLAMVVSLSSESLMDIIISTNIFYLPVVTVPFIMTVLGFRSTGKSVIIGMIAGFSALLICKILQLEDVTSVIPSMLANLIFLLGAHYLLRQPGGWVGIKDDTPLQEARDRRKRMIRQFVQSIKNFNLITFLRTNSGITTEATYVYCGIFAIVSICSTAHALPQATKIQYAEILAIIYPTVLLMATGLLSYPLWLKSWKDASFISVYWNVCIFYILICASFTLVIISNFCHIQLMAFMINLVVIAVSLRWKWALFLISTGIILTIESFKFYLNVDHLPEQITSIEFQTTYLLLLTSGMLFIFLRPQQEHTQFLDEKVHYLEDESAFHKKEISQLLDMKYEFLRNIEHESRTPITGIMSMAQVLNEAYDKLTDTQKRDAIQHMASSSERLNSWASNIVDLARLTATSAIQKESINITNLIMERLEICKKLYLHKKQGNEHVFVLEIDANVELRCDRYYIARVLDNLIINAMQYSHNGTITLSLRASSKDVIFSIQDEGVGIPGKDLYDIFGIFTVSSKTKTPAGGKGIGLALCKTVIELHAGRIWAESDGQRGATFKVVIPVS